MRHELPYPHKNVYGGLILGVNTLYRLFCIFNLFPMVAKGLNPKTGLKSWGGLGTRLPRRRCLAHWLLLVVLVSVSSTAAASCPRVSQLIVLVSVSSLAAASCPRVSQLIGCC